MNQHTHRKHFHRNTAYTVTMTDPKTGEPTIQKITFTHSLLRYACNPNGKREGQFKYAIMERVKFNQGGFAKLYKSNHSIYPTCKNLSNLIESKNHAVKVGKLYKAEYLYAPNLLRAKPITYLNKVIPTKSTPKKKIHYGVMVCNFFKIPDLETLLIQDRNKSGQDRLNAVQRLEICLAVTKALEEQTHQRDIIHRDIKPENIKISYSKDKGKYEVVILDYGLSRHQSNNDRRLVGTPSYSSPEQYHDGITSHKSDIYSLACVFTEILGCDRKNAIQSMREIFAEYEYSNLLTYNMCKNFPDAKYLPEMPIKTLVKKMVAFNDSARPDTEQIKAQLEMIKKKTLVTIETEKSITHSI